MIFEVNALCNIIRLAGGEDFAPEEELVAFGNVG